MESVGVCGGGDPLGFVDPEGLQVRPPRGIGTSLPMFPRIGPSSAQVGGSYSTTTQGSLREITGRGRMTDMRGSAREAFDAYRGDTPATCTQTRDGATREVATLPNGTVVQLRDGRIDVFPPGDRPETIHFGY